MRHRPRPPRPDLAAVARLGGVLGLAALVTGCGLADRADEADPSEAERTTTTYVISGLRYAVGDCVIFDEDATDPRRKAEIVPCDRPHVLEIVGIIEMETPGDRFPGDRQKALNEERCEELAAEYLGEPHLPRRRYENYNLRITPDGWARGERTYRCGLAEYDPTSPGAMRAKVIDHSVRDRSQLDHPAVGTCQTTESQQRADRELPVDVPCSQPHGWEVTAVIDAPEDRWKGDAEQVGVVMRACESELLAYAGRVPPDRKASYLPVTKLERQHGEDQLVCLAIAEDGAPFTGAVRRP